MHITGATIKYIFTLSYVRASDKKLDYKKYLKEDPMQRDGIAYNWRCSHKLMQPGKSKDFKIEQLQRYLCHRAGKDKAMEGFENKDNFAF